jgi:Right handed beta helix region
MRFLLRLILILTGVLPLYPLSRGFVATDTGNAGTAKKASDRAETAAGSPKCDRASAGNLANGPTKGDKVQYVRANGIDSNDGLDWSSAKKSLSCAASALLRGGTIYLADTQTIASHLNFSANDMRIDCKNRGTLAFASGTGHYITWSGTNQSVRNCLFIGPGGGSAIEAGGDHFTFENNTIKGLPLNGGNGELTIYKGSHDLIAYNRFYDNSDWDIEVNNTTASQSIEDIQIVGNHAGEVIAHTTAPASQINHLVIAGNVLLAAQNHKTEFCVEVGAFGGLPPNYISVTGNSCRLTANGADGGFSMSAVNHAAESGSNVFDAAGFTYTIAPFEDVVCSNCVIAGNVVNDGPGGNGISIDRSTDTVVSGNTITGFLVGRYGYGIHVFVCNSTNPSATGNTISNNKIVFPTSGAGRGIWQQCKATGANCRNNIYTGNTIVSDGTTGSIGILIENDNGTTSGTIVTGNNLRTPATLVSGTTFEELPRH